MLIVSLYRSVIHVRLPSNMSGWKDNKGEDYIPPVSPIQPSGDEADELETFIEDTFMHGDSSPEASIPPAQRPSTMPTPPTPGSSTATSSMIPRASSPSISSPQRSRNTSFQPTVPSVPSHRAKFASHVASSSRVVAPYLPMGGSMPLAEDSSRPSESGMRGRAAAKALAGMPFTLLV